MYLNICNFFFGEREREGKEREKREWNKNYKCCIKNIIVRILNLLILLVFWNRKNVKLFIVMLKM